MVVQDSIAIVPQRFQQPLTEPLYMEAWRNNAPVGFSLTISVAAFLQV